MKAPANNRPVKVGLCGTGTVGAGVFELLQHNAELIAARAGAPVLITHIGARRKPAFDIGDCRLSKDILKVADDPEVDILVEVIGGTDAAKELVHRAIARGKHVVTANKALLAEHGNELLAEAEAAGARIAFEAAVAGGVPVIKALREGLAANRVRWLAGIINGTGNFILSEMGDKGRPFAEALAEAQALGYAEADPGFDVDGVDAAHKLVILAAIAFGIPLQFDQVYTEGIRHIEPADIAWAGELGYRIKHLGIARDTGRGIELRVHPTLIPAKQLLANVDGVLNGLMVEGDAVGPTLYYGAGAGAAPTASAAAADIIDLARELARGRILESGAAGRAAGGGAAGSLGIPVSQVSANARPIVPIEEVETAFYLRMTADDQPGVLSEVSRICSEAGISIEALIQKPPAPGQTQVPLIILSNRVREAAMREAAARIEAMERIRGHIIRIRVESLDGSAEGSMGGSAASSAAGSAKSPAERPA